jgi:hypothetical protein
MWPPLAAIAMAAVALALAVAARPAFFRRLTARRAGGARPLPGAEGS